MNWKAYSGRTDHSGGHSVRGDPGTLQRHDQQETGTYRHMHICGRRDPRCQFRPGGRVAYRYPQPGHNGPGAGMK